MIESGWREELKLHAKEVVLKDPNTNSGKNLQCKNSISILIDFLTCSSLKVVEKKGLQNITQEELVRAIFIMSITKVNQSVT